MIHLFKTSAALALILATTGAAQAQDGKAYTLNIEGFAGTLEIVTGDYDDISFDGTDDEVSFDEGRSFNINIDTDADDKFKSRSAKSYSATTGWEHKGYLNCRTQKTDLLGLGGSSESEYKSQVKFKKRGDWVDVEDLPSLKVKGPRNMRLTVKDSLVFGTAGDLDSADIHIDSCGDMRIGDVDGELQLRINGSGDFDGGDADVFVGRINGSGDFSVKDVNSASVTVNGSGDGNLGHIGGDTDIKVQGSGDITADHVDGDVEIALRGSGDIMLGEVYGDADISINGSGDIEINGGDLPSLYVDINGSGDVSVDATVDYADIEAYGSGDVEIAKVTGTVKKSGHGDLEIDGKRWKDTR